MELSCLLDRNSFYLYQIEIYQLDSASTEYGKEDIQYAIAQLCVTLCSPVDYSLPGSSVQAILQAKILQWVAFPFSGDLPKAGIEPRSPALQAYSLHPKPPGKPKYNTL